MQVGQQVQVIAEDHPHKGEAGVIIANETVEGVTTNTIQMDETTTAKGYTLSLTDSEIKHLG